MFFKIKITSDDDPLPTYNDVIASKSKENLSIDDVTEKSPPPYKPN